MDEKQVRDEGPQQKSSRAEEKVELRWDRKVYWCPSEGSESVRAGADEGTKAYTSVHGYHKVLHLSTVWSLRYSKCELDFLEIGVLGG